MTLKPIKAKAIVDRLVPGTPVISTDGRLVAFTVAPVGYKGEHAKRSIWLSRDGAPARQFTSGKAVDSNPVFSPDGSKLAFLSNRNDDEKSQIFTIPLDGGEATRFGKLEGSLEQLKWAPDGSALSVLRRQPETKKRKKMNEKLDDAVVVDGEPRFNRIFVLDAESGKKREIDSGKREVWDYAWSPDSSQLAFVTAEETGEDAPMLRGDVWIVERDG
jgi:dipeptidyl aminopeptidase/acylaminoacyl peptidase